MSNKKVPVTPRMPQAQRTISLTQLYPLQQKKSSCATKKILKTVNLKQFLSR